MKYLLLVTLAVVGCAASTPAPVAQVNPIEDSPPPAVMIAGGTNGEGVEWRCSLETFTGSLGWVECHFRNTKPHPVASGCAKVGFWLESSGKLVAEGDLACSGNLIPGQETTKYVAFRNEKRQALRLCGESLQSCVMLAGNYHE